MHNDDRPFSRRFGYVAAEQEITIREDAPESLRAAVVMLADNLGLSPKTMRHAACGVLLTKPDPGNWSDYPNVFQEVQWLVEGCAWPKVYDIAEEFYRCFDSRDPDAAKQFEGRLNEFFRENGIGWAMERGRIVARGSEAFSAVPKQAIELLGQTGRQTAAKEIHEAIQDLSRRPKPDITGSIQHAMASLECVMRELTGHPGKTLGKLLSDHRTALNIPRPLDDALDKMWGYASETGRHLREGREPRFEEAELVVTVAAAVAIYLSRPTT